jgi:hypothetical protein
MRAVLAATFSRTIATERHNYQRVRRHKIQEFENADRSAYPQLKYYYQDVSVSIIKTPLRKTYD